MTRSFLEFYVNVFNWSWFGYILLSILSFDHLVKWSKSLVKKHAAKTRHKLTLYLEGSELL